MGLGAANANFPPDFGFPLELMSKGYRRHIAFVLDKNEDTASFYVDGQLLGEVALAPGTVADMDCGMVNYTGEVSEY